MQGLTITTRPIPSPMDRGSVSPPGRHCKKLCSLQEVFNNILTFGYRSIPSIILYF